MKNASLIYSGSVKDIYKIEEEQVYIFHFSNRYSIFDWGAMPDELNGKAKSLSTMADFFFHFFENRDNWKGWEPELGADIKKRLLGGDVFRSLQEKGLQHHSLGLVDERGSSLASGDFSENLKVSPVDVLSPKHSNGNWDYSMYNSRPSNTLVPLEVIFRFGVPKGSSFLKRSKDDSYLASLGLISQEVPKEGEFFNRPVVEFSTKLEPEDRILPYSSAKEIAGLSEVELNRLLDTSLLLALRMKDIFSSLGLELWDGKFEFAFTEKENGERQFQLIDSIGPDELRIIANGVQLSKESLRQVYSGSEWHLAVEEAKKLAKQEGQKDWKDLFKEKYSIAPDILPQEYKAIIEGMYLSLANALFEKFSYPVRFSEAPALATVISDLSKFKEIKR